MIDRYLKKWLCFMMVPFIFGVLVHFLVPMMFTLFTYSRIEQGYNAYKIESEQNLVRGLAMFNSRIVSNRIQSYQNIRRVLINIF